MLKILKRLVRKGINGFKYVFNNVFGKLRCPVCGNRVIKYEHFPLGYIDEYYKHHFIYSIFCFETLNLIDYSCPICRTNDSTRLYALYLKERLNKLDRDIKFLDIAPTIRLIKLIKSFGKVIYRNADLYMKEVDDKVDLVDMAIYKDNTFDMIICTHVLEHIKDDQKAINELYRILKFNGEAIVQVPILTIIERDYEDGSAKTDDDRWRCYGEPSHVRVYSKNGFVIKLRTAGFKVEQLGVEHFGEDVFSRNGIAKTSVLYVVKKLSVH